MTTKIWYDISRDDCRMAQFHERDGVRYVQYANGEIHKSEKYQLLPDEAFTTIKEPVELLDELLKAGYRPSNNAWSSGHVAALEKHIAFAEKVAIALLEPATASRNGDLP